MSAPFELVNPRLARGRFRLVLFDFDGTLSLLREDWTEVMVSLMVAELGQVGATASDAALAEEAVLRLNGLPTIHQMNWLADEVRRRGGRPADPEEYKRRYLDRLRERLADRYAELPAAAAKWAVPGSHEFLADLGGRGLPLVLASGTDLPDVRREAALLQLDGYFGPATHGPHDGDRAFTKGRLIDRLLRENGLRGEELLAFGDGFVEIEEVKRVGGVAVAVASDVARPGQPHPDKRHRLIRAGADAVIADYRRPDELLRVLFDP